MNRSVMKQMGEVLDIFNSMPNCTVEEQEDGRYLIASRNPVLWSDSLEKKDRTSLHKIGYITPHKASLGLYIDFPHDYLDVDRAEDIINPERTLMYYAPGVKAPTVKSWWRFRSNEQFDSIHLVLRKIELDLYDFKREDWIELMKEITEVHQ
ncbi:hypothetical protein BN1080_02825 [Planococcus massiliensis]|uniref:Uncharacterized protein n=1 Tax=Planococcus massiliensis TaxID=1499687 RepID=A0A098ENE7_9BACL|nr:hypothetical protein [Planococcus massiliensis]CEG23818.1 hypothetical protein BN1080_02825 [Planococcus massiliensis]